MKLRLQLQYVICTTELIHGTMIMNS